MPKTTSATAAVSKKSDEKGAVQKVPAKKVVVKKQSSASVPVKTQKPTELPVKNPCFRFYPSRDLHSHLIEILDEIQNSADATACRAKLSDCVKELTAGGFDYYVAGPLKDAKVGFVTQQTANLGLLGVQQVMTPVIRNIIGRLEHAQLQAIAQSIRQLMN